VTLWEFVAAWEGYLAANATEEKAPAMSDERATELGIEGF
jgi:hypothetical protein